MNELRFRGGDLKADRRRAAWTLVVIAFQTAVAVLRIGPVGALSVIAVVAVLFAAFLAVQRRSWTAVGEDGIRIHRGFGRVRSYPWREIRRVAERRQHGPNGEAVSVRITLVSGRRRTLPGISSNPVFPDPHFALKLAQVLARWEQHTGGSSGIGDESRERLSRRLRGVLPGVLALVAAVLTMLFTVRLLDDVDAARRYDSAPSCTVVPPVDPGGCRAVEPHRTVRIVPDADGGSGAELTVRRKSDDEQRTLRFAALPAHLWGLQYGDPVQVTTGLDGRTATEVSVDGVSAPTVDHPDGRVVEGTAELVWALASAVLFTAWCVATRRAPRGRYPWWAPLALPGPFMAMAIADSTGSSDVPLTPWSYWPAAVALLLGVGLGYAVIGSVRAARRHREPAPRNATP
ncbi:hypothetical protein [Kitasatospora sp. NPDC059599]|uniref:hypothetical protein n=1 Tax=Kitasatospora sp. NPDC059599 TaxID=3346880 RepID=UPI0036AD6D42